jgi:epoxyqueuosine reductase
VSPDAGAFLAWAASGMAGRMGYLTDHRADLRTDPRYLLPSARSVLCVGKLYDASRSGEPISRYAQIPDYHDTMRRDLERVVERLHEECGPFELRICVDTAPMLERSGWRDSGGSDATRA